MKRIRILYLINNMNPGGAQRYVIDLMNALDKDIFDIRIVSLGSRNFFKNETYVSYREIGINKNKPNLFLLISLYNEIKVYNPHIIHTQLRYADTLGQLIGVLTKVPIRISTIHGTVEWKRDRLSIIHLIEDYALQYSNLIIAVSESVKEYIITKRHVSPEKVKTLHCGINLMPFINGQTQRINMRSYLSIEPQSVVFACTAHFRPEKRHDVLLHRFSRLLQRSDRKLYLFLIGNEGPLENNIKDMIQALNLQNNVLILGGNRDAVAEYLSASDIFVMFSESEGTSLAVAEGMATGMPALLPRLPHFSSQIKDGIDGFLFDLNSEDDFLVKANRLIDSASLRGSLGANARKHSLNEYDIRNHVSIIKYYYLGCYKKWYDKKYYSTLNETE